MNKQRSAVRTLPLIVVWLIILVVLSADHRNEDREKFVLTPQSLSAWTGNGGMNQLSGIEVKTHDANGVRFAVTARGQMGKDVLNNIGLGYWPGWTLDNYVFGMGLWVGSIADVDGDGIKDTVAVCGYDPRNGLSEYREGWIGQDPADPLARVFSSTVLEDIEQWPELFRNKNGEPDVQSLQDFVTIYNDVSGDPLYEAGRCGLEIRQRSMAFLGGLNYNTILIFFEIVNLSDSLPGGPFTLEESYVSFVSDIDIGWDFADDMTSVLDEVDIYRDEIEVLNTVITWDSDFDELNFAGTPGMVGIFFLQPPGNSWDGLDNDGDGLVDESPFDSVDDDGDGEPDDIPDEVDSLDDFHYTIFTNPVYGLMPSDPASDREAYRMMSCQTGADCRMGDDITDVRFMISCGPFDLPPGEKQIAGVAVTFAHTDGDPDHLELQGDPPRPDPGDPVLSDLVATIIGLKNLYRTGFETDFKFFEILGTTDHGNTNHIYKPYSISTSVVDSVPVARTTLHYSVDQGPFNEIPMEKITDRFYAGEIPTQPFWSDISYFIQAVDSAYQTQRDPEDSPVSTYDFTVMDVPDFSRWLCGSCGLGIAAAASDFDFDGAVDLFIATSEGPLLYRNTGDFTFDDVTDISGTAALSAVRGGSWGDFDNDGYPDLFIASFSNDTTHVLFRNVGDGKFENVTVSAGVMDTIETSTGIWGDVDGDGYIDLLTVQAGRDRLYINSGEGSFEERSEEWLIGETGNDKTASFFDLEGDGDLDLVITGGGETFVYENREKKHFEDVTRTSGIRDEFWKSIATGDYDNDGDQDILFSGSTITLYQNVDGEFKDVTEITGLSGLVTHDASWFDANMDGLLDIGTTEPSLFIRKPDGMFQDLSGLARLSEGTGNRFFPLPVDFDNDGSPDLVINDFWRNEGCEGYHPKHWLMLALKGSYSNRSAIGARATVYAGGLRAARWISGGEGRSQDPPVLSFGLGTFSVIDSLVIDWPSGSTQRLMNFSSDVRITIEEDSFNNIGDDDVTTPNIPHIFSLGQNYPNPFNPATTISFSIPSADPPGAGGGSSRGAGSHGTGSRSSVQRVTLVIYDMRGRLVRTLMDEQIEPGRYTVTWDGRSERGEEVSSGAYLYTLKSDISSTTRKMVVLR